MSGAQLIKASRIRIPNDVGRTQNDFGSKKIAVTTTHGQEALAKEWSGQYVYLVFDASSGDIVHVAASKTTGGEVDRSAAASNNSTTPANVLKVGLPIFADGQPVHVQLPTWDNHETGYLIHEGSASGTLYMFLG